MEPVTFTLEADFDFDELYESDLTPYLNSIGGGFRVARQFDTQGRYQTSTVNLGLDNNSGAFSPEYTGSPFYGLLEPDVPIRLLAEAFGQTWALWTGYVQEWNPVSAAIGRRRCNLTGHDLMAIVRGANPLSITVDERTTGAALEAIATAMGLEAGDYVFDTGEQVLPIHYAAQQDGRDAANQAVMSEMGGRDYVNASGQWIFEGRRHRLGTASAFTWGDGTGVRPAMVNARYSTEERISKVSVQASIYTLGQAGDEIFFFSRGMRNYPPDSIEIAANSQYGPVDVPWDDLAIAVTTPQAAVDYLGNSAIDGSGTDRTSQLEVTVVNNGANATLTVRNTHATNNVFVTRLRVRGQTATFAGQQPVFTAEKGVVGMKAMRGVTLAVPFADDSNTARDYSVSTLRTYRYTYPRVDVTFEWAGDAVVADMLAVEVGDLVWFEDTALGVRASGFKDWFYVEGLVHERRVSESAVQWPQTTVTLVPSYLYRDLDAIAYDNFSRDNATGDLGQSTSDDTWADDSGFDISGGYAVPNATGLQVPNVLVA